MTFLKDGSTTFSAEFLLSSFYNTSKKDGHISRGMFVGGIEPDPHWGPTSVAGANDNNYIKCHKVGDDDMVLSDTPVAALLKNDFGSFDEVIRPNMMALGTHGKSWNDHLSMDTHICASGIMAHGQTDPLTGRFIGELSCMGLMEDTKLHEDYHILFEIDPATPTKRKLLTDQIAVRAQDVLHALVRFHSQPHRAWGAAPAHVCDAPSRR
jgi:hypothetical protein